MNNPLPPGTPLKDGRYRVQGLHKMGGQSIVYEGSEVKSGQPIIIKQNSEDQEWSHVVLRQEASLLDDLSHPSLPRVLDCFGERGSTFLIMSRVPGSDAGELLRRRGTPFHPAEVLGWAYQLLDILEYLQSQDPIIIHRDINPRNIRLTPDNQIFLLDFGIAKRIDLKTFLVGGTPRYAPPEQLKDEGTDPRTDVYALAATLYYLLTAHEPPDALSRESALLKGLPDPLRPAYVLNAAVQLQVSQVLSLALNLERERRPSSAAVMRQLLSEAEKGLFSDEVTRVSPANEADPETTRVSIKNPDRLVIPFEFDTRGDATQEATQLVALLDSGHNIDPSLVQILIELLDAPLEQRRAILARHSDLLRKKVEVKAQVALALIRRLATDSYIESNLRKQLRQKLGRLIADRTLSEILSGSEKHRVPEEKAKSFQTDADNIQRHLTHRKWLRAVAIRLVRGVMAAVAIQLSLIFFTGGETLVKFLSRGGWGLWVAHILLLGLGIILVLLIRRIKDTTALSDEEPTLTWRLTAFGFGALIALIFYHDLLWATGVT